MAKNQPPIEHQIKPGEVRNPNGRPKRKGSYADSLHKVMTSDEVVLSLKINGKTNKNTIKTEQKNFYMAVAIVQLREALRGNMVAIKDIADRIDGKPMQAVEVDDKTDDKLTATDLKAFINALNTKPDD